MASSSRRETSATPTPVAQAISCAATWSAVIGTGELVVSLASCLLLDRVQRCIRVDDPALETSLLDLEPLDLRQDRLGLVMERARRDCTPGTDPARAFPGASTQTTPGIQAAATGSRVGRRTPGVEEWHELTPPTRVADSLK